MNRMQIQAHTFQPRDLVGGDVVLDLVNTVTARNAEPIDWFDGYPHVLDWARLSGTFDDGALLQLETLSAADPRGAGLAVNRLRDLRESLVEVLSAVLEQRDARPDSLHRLEEEWRDGVAHAHFGGQAGVVRPEVSVATSGLDYLRHDLALRAVDLLERLQLDRTRVCPGPRCGWLFVDLSRGGGRRWCDMATCGNASKSRRHYERHRRRGASDAVS
jgi:predicted RNA-binding Zn ribbon-like protein